MVGLLFLAVTDDRDGGLVHLGLTAARPVVWMFAARWWPNRRLGARRAA